MQATFRAALDAGPQLGLCVMYPAPGIIERIGPDWDWIWVDGQHGELDYGEILAAVRASDLINRPAIVRVPGHEAGTIGKVLDTAATGVMVPMVNTSQEAQAIVKAAKFPPLGQRSYGGRRPVDAHGRGYANADQPQPHLVCQIETPEGVANAEAIAAVPGVDGLVIGADDLALNLGMRMDVPRPPGHFDDALRKVAQAARDQGKYAGGVFVTPDALQPAIEMGYRLIIGTADVTCLANGSKQSVDALRNARSAGSSQPPGGQNSTY